ncbi:MAG: rhomboid family intramembrane serine protease, partial [Anaerolineae bacterium]|nr:rhomboid family intramembrane serine protease [Anaerolineae bacterium]
IVLYFASGFAAALAQVVINPDSTIPLVGASGAIAGVLGSYLVLFPVSKYAALSRWAECRQWQNGRRGWYWACGLCCNWSMVLALWAPIPPMVEGLRFLPILAALSLGWC